MAASSLPASCLLAVHLPTPSAPTPPPHQHLLLHPAHPRLPPSRRPQFAFNTLQRVSPVAHGVCNVVKRVAIIFSSVIFFNQTLTPIALTGTVVALAGTWLYTEMSSRWVAGAGAVLCCCWCWYAE
jgi:hypothetical protein